LISEEIIFNGHPNILSLHSRTVEITKDKNLTLNGDCIIGVNARKGCRDLDTRLKEKIQKSNSNIEIEVIVEPFSHIIKGKGDSNLLLSHPHDIVLRKSSFICDRTLSIKCDCSSKEIPRKMIDLLKNFDTKGTMRICVY
jgi:hypothetical protein